MEGVKVVDIDKIKKAPSERYGHTTCVVQNRLFLFGGSSTDGKVFYNDMQIFDLDKMEWRKTHLTSGLIGRHFHSCVATNNDDLSTSMLIFFGGKSNGYLNDVFTFKIATNSFQNVEPKYKNEEKKSSCMNDSVLPPSPRYGHSACYYNKRMFVFGGYDHRGFTKNDLYCFNFKKNMWRKFVISSIPYRYHHSGVLLGCNYFILGGINKKYQPLDDIYRLDLTEVVNNKKKEEAEEEGEEEEEEENEDDHGVEAFALSQDNPIASYGHKCFLLEDKIYMYGGRDETQEFKHLLRLEHGEGNLRWVVVVDNSNLIDESKLNLSYGTLDFHNDNLLFFGGQHRGKKKLPRKKLEDLTEEEVREIERLKVRVTEDLPLDCAFIIFEYLELRDLVHICSVSKSRWFVSVSCRSDRVWAAHYKEQREKTTLSAFRLKTVKREKTTYEKYRKLRNLERIEALEHMARGGTFLKKGKGYVKTGSRKDVKLVIVGNGAVGKTCLLISFANKGFPEDYVPTVFDNSTHDFIYKFEQQVSLGLWDTAGEEDYDRLRPLSYPETDVFLICFSLVDRWSYDAVESKWKPELQMFNDGVAFPIFQNIENMQKRPKKPIPIVLCGTKFDLRDDEYLIRQLEENGETAVTYEEGVALAKRIGASAYFETSAKTQHNLKNLFDACTAIALGDDWMEVLGDRAKDKCGIM